MSELTSEFNALPPEHQAVLRLAQERYNITVKPLQQITGGLSGAFLYLVSVSSAEGEKVEHLVLKLDQLEDGEPDEVEQHALALDQAPPDFAEEHMADLAFEQVELDGSIAIFYRIAGESLQEYRPLSKFKLQSQLEAIFRVISMALLDEWNAAARVDQASHPQSLLPRWLGYRLHTGSRIERFLEEGCQVDSGTAGLVIEGTVYPNPLLYARKAEPWGAARSIDVLTGLQHGDLNTNNILVRMSNEGSEVGDYYLIDFADFAEQMPLLFDHLYLELAYLMSFLSSVPFASWIDFVMRFAQDDLLDAQEVPIELSGRVTVINANRRAFDSWLKTTHPSLHDDLWGQFWLAGVAAGLNFGNKGGLSNEVRLAALTFAAAHLKRYMARFGLPPPTETAHLYDAGQADGEPLAQPESRATHHLPIPPAPLVGREPELAEIAGLLADPDRRLLTLVGPGGIGKTHLALEAARGHVETFKHGVYFVPLAPISSADSIVQAMTEALGLSFTGGDDPKVLLLRFLRNRQMLLVMDNFEHVLAGAPLLNEVLENAPEVTFLATTREKLNLRSEIVFNVTGLEFSDWQTPEEALAQSAAQLFVQYAGRVQPNFSLGEEEAHAVKKICELVEGMPLAILLAASWSDVLSPHEIADEISHSLDFLETELRDVPPRQRSIRAAFNTSWERLSQAERELFKKLSVFRDGFTRQAAEKVAGASLRTLAALVNKSLLRHDPGRARYEAHDLLRQYAAEQLEVVSEASQAANEAHAIYFAEYMEEMSDQLRSDRENKALDEIEHDIENVRKAWRYLAAQGNAVEIRKIIDSLWLFHEIRGWLHTGLELFRDAQATLTSTASGEAREAITAHLQAVSAWFISLLGFSERGLEMAQESLATLRRLDRRTETIHSLNAIATSNYSLNRNTEFMGAARELGEIAREVGYKWWEANSLNWLATGSLEAQALDDAGRYARASAEMFDEIGVRSIWPGQALAEVAAGRGDYVQAKELYQLALETAEESNFRRGVQQICNNLGLVTYLLEEFEEAEGYYLQSLRIAYGNGQTREVLGDLKNIARVWTSLEKGTEAVYLLAVVLRYPASEQKQHGTFTQTSIHDDAEQLRAELEAELPPEDYAAAWQRGQALEVEAVVDEMLEQASGHSE
jgi:predicted ATPase